MSPEIFHNISKIIERDSKSTTYKFALLRGVIDVIQENSPYMDINKDFVRIPTGLLVEKWLLYYYPIFDAQLSITQIHGNASLAFSKEFNDLVNAYKGGGGFSAFYNDFSRNGIPNRLADNFEILVKKLRDTITKMPMKYIGRSISNDYYSIFQFENPRLKSGQILDRQFIIENLGSFTISRNYFEAFKLLGSFLNGQDSILFKWAEFSVSASNGKVSLNHILHEILQNPITEREIEASKKLYFHILGEEGAVICVWSGQKLTKYDIDHVIPFSIWKNNDLWNLLPAKSSLNNQKRDKIPSPNLIDSCRSQIITYWEMLLDYQPNRFQKEMQISLLGNHSFASWKSNGIKQLQENCRYLIENRGFEEWNIQS